MIKKSALLFSDILAFIVAFCLAYALRLAFSAYDKSLLQTLGALWWSAPIIIVSFINEGLYTKRRPFWMEARFAIRALTLAFLAIFAVVSLGKLSSDVSRLFLILLAFLSAFIFPLSRKFFKRFSASLEPVVIIGSGKLALSCAEALLKDGYLGYKVIGFLDDERPKGEIMVNDKKFKLFGKINSIGKFSAIGVKTAIIALESNEKAFSAINVVHKNVKNILFAPDAKGLPLANTESFFLFEQDIFLLTIRNNLESLTAQRVKRAFDLIMAILILPFIAPILAFISIRIKQGKDGSAIFSQSRMGLNAKPFMCYKFRTMRSDGAKILIEYLAQNEDAKKEWDRFKKLKGYDPRITKIGAFLRKTSLDELPQIFNILKGDMSFVGPRPYLYNEKADMQGRDGVVLMCKPGITGLWQIRGRNELDFEERVRLDVWYVTNWSLWLDAVILFKTVKVVLKREGAY